MEYKLAQQLKEAGFPQTTKQFLFGYNFRDGSPTIWKLQTWDEHCTDPQEEAVIERYAAPTLEELIEACEATEERQVELYWDGKRALASIRGGFKAPVCSTLKEAVARLWLAFNPPLNTPGSSS